MRPIQIFTDSCSDLPLALRQEYNITAVPLAYVIDGVAYPDDSWVKNQPSVFYNQMRQGAAPTTAQATTGAFTEHFTAAIASGSDILYIGFSSALSGTLNAAVLAKNNMLRSNPEAKIIVIDTFSASLGLGLLVFEAAKKAQAGETIEAISAWVEEHKLNVNQWFTVGDLEYLRRGGRISNFASAIGSILQVKPVLRVDAAGRLVPFSKVRGRKKSLDELFKLCAERIESPENQTIAISHGDCLAEAEELAERIKAELHVQQVIVHAVGPVIGSHSGPETMALFFWGVPRE